MNNDHYLLHANWQHRSTKRVYGIVGFSTREDDQAILVTYRLSNDSSSPLWTRPADEFFDGRFIRLFPGFEDRA
jgi:hypothetical protein